MNTPLRYALLSLLAALGACGGGSDGDAGSPFSGFGGGAVGLQFEARAGTAAVDCASSMTSLGTGSANARLKDLRFHIANVSLVKADGTEVPLALTIAANDNWNARSGSETLTLIDLEDATGTCAGGTSAMNAVINGTVPAGDYVAVKMSMGVPQSLNHLDPFALDTPRALTSPSLGWNWTTGRIFAKIEVTDPNLSMAPTWPAPVFTAHLGALSCTGDPAAGQAASCAIPNRMAFTLGDATAPFNPNLHKIVIDVQALLAGNDVTINTPGTASGCMSALDDPECVPMFNALKIAQVTGLPINGGLGQLVFKAVNR
jgi:uncharacterized repeat protein (TIGR04052 family)